MIPGDSIIENAVYLSLEKTVPSVGLSFNVLYSAPVILVLHVESQSVKISS